MDWRGAVAFVCLSTAGAFAQTPPETPSFRDALPDWLDLQPEFRARYEGRDGNPFDILVPHGVQTRALLGVDLKPDRRFRVHLQGMDARVPTIARERLNDRYRGVFELREAYVELGDPEQGHWRLRAGRQTHSYGAERILARANWSNTRRVFDAVKLAYSDYDFTVDVFTGSEVNERMDRPDWSDYGRGLHGAYSTWRNWIPNAEVDLYLLYRTRRRVVDELGRTGDGDLWTPGVRIDGELSERVDYEIEWNVQRGDYAESDVRAQTFTAVGGYRWEDAPARPRLFAQYQYASGDSDPTDGVFGTADQFSPANHRYRGAADLIGYRNLRAFGAGLELAPSSRATLEVQVDHYGLASGADGFYTFGADLWAPRVPGGTSSTGLGVEVDVTGTYRLNPFTVVSAGIARFQRRGFFRDHTDFTSATFSYLGVEFRP